MIRRLLLSLALLPALLLTPVSQSAFARGRPVTAGVVSAADPRAAAAGIEMLKAGGSAVDAAIAVQLVLNVVEPQNSGLGGGSFFVFHDGRTGALSTIDGREAAPAAATPDWFLGQDGKPLPYGQIGNGGRSAGVPGALRVMALAHKQHGKLPWATLFQPAIRLARDGFTVSPRLHNGLARYARGMSTQDRATWFDSKGEALPIGSTFRNPALAGLFEQVARLGPDSFYVGPTAQKIVTALNTAEASQSAMTPGDLATYEAKARNAGLRHVPGLQDLRHGAALGGVRSRCCRSSSSSSASISPGSAAPRRSPGTCSLNPRASLMPIATCIWPTLISWRCRSPACSTRPISPSARR